MFKPDDLRQNPNALAKNYSRFRVAERLLFTGHSHQAWPDCGFDGQQRAWLDAAEWVDEKWDKAFAAADRVRAGFARLLDDAPDRIALASNTHDLVIRFLSGLPLRQRRRLVTTDGEYHTIRRQLDRLAEEGIEVVRVPATPADQVAQRLIDMVDERTAAVMVSSVMYRNSHIVTGLGSVLAACRQNGAELLVDAYHALNAVPFSLPSEGLGGAFIVGGGYKYCQLGEGNCFMRFPPECKMRPVVTGWFSEFDILAASKADSGVGYSAGPSRFAGSTYDPTSHYRAAEVFDFFHNEKLTPEFLREVSQHQMQLMATLFDELDTDPRVISRERVIDLTSIGGFLALAAPKADDFFEKLRQRGVLSDYRGEVLRLGPAPYLCDDQLRQAIGLVGEVARELSR